jgi:hypothetical protein
MAMRAYSALSEQATERQRACGRSPGKRGASQHARGVSGVCGKPDSSFALAAVLIPDCIDSKSMQHRIQREQE